MSNLAVALGGKAASSVRRPAPLQELANHFNTSAKPLTSGAVPQLPTPFALSAQRPSCLNHANSSTLGALPCL